MKGQPLGKMIMRRNLNTGKTLPEGELEEGISFNGRINGPANNFPQCDKMTIKGDIPKETAVHMESVPLVKDHFTPIQFIYFICRGSYNSYRETLVNDFFFLFNREKQKYLHGTPKYKVKTSAKNKGYFKEKKKCLTVKNSQTTATTTPATYHTVFRRTAPVKPKTA